MKATLSVSMFKARVSLAVEKLNEVVLAFEYSFLAGVSRVKRKYFGLNLQHRFLIILNSK